MRIAYLTTDEVNEDLALRLAAECGVMLCPLSPRELARAEAFDAAVYDWDYLPSPQQQEVLAALLAGPAPRPVAIHSYNLDDGQMAALREQAVGVFRRLQPEIFRFLRLAATHSQAARLGVGGQDDDPGPGTKGSCARDAADTGATQARRRASPIALPGRLRT